MASSLPAKKFWFVDDNQIILNVLSSALKSGGYEVFAAVDGPAAFTVVLQEQPTSSCSIFSFRPTSSRVATPGMVSDHALAPMHGRTSGQSHSRIRHFRAEPGNSGIVVWRRRS